MLRTWQRIQLVGRLGLAPVVGYTAQTSRPCVRIPVAVDREDGEGRKFTTWLQVAFWDAHAHELAGAARKGAAVYVEGVLVEYEKHDHRHKDGKYRTWEIRAFKFEVKSNPRAPETPIEAEDPRPNSPEDVGHRAVVREEGR